MVTETEGAEPSVAAELGAHARLNLATTVIGFVFSVGTGLWFTPFLVHSLGPSAYGLVPLATMVVSYFSLLTQTLSSVLNRSISMALASGDRARASRAFETALGGACLVILVLMPPLAALSWWAPSLFTIPEGAAIATRWLFAIVGAALLLSIVSTPYQAIAFGQNRIYIVNSISLFQTLIRISLTVLLFEAAAASITNAGLGILAAAVAGFVFSIASARMVAPAVSMWKVALDRHELRSMSKTSSHVMIMQIGTVLTTSCEVVIANKLFGAYEGGRYAAAMQWMLLLRVANMSLVVLCVPTILRLVAAGSRDELIAYTRKAMTWSAVFVAFPAGFLCSLSPTVLTAWLGPHFTDLWPLVVVQLLPLIFSSTVLPLYSITLGTDRMLVAGLAQLVLGAVGVVIAVIFGSVWGMIGVAIGVNWSFALKEILFTPGYAARNIDSPYGTFLGPLARVAGLFGVAVVLSWVAGKVFAPATMLQLFLTGVVTGLAYLGVVALVARQLLWDALALLKIRVPFAAAQPVAAAARD